MIDVEKVVIGSLLLDQRVFRAAATECTPHDFDDHRLGKIFSGISRMIAEREPVDLITVSSRLPDWEIRGIDGSDLGSWMLEVPTAANVGYYAEQVRKRALKRGLLLASRALQDNIELADPEALIGQALSDLRNLQKDHVLDEITTQSLAEVMATPIEYDWVIEGLLERRERFMVTGGEGGGKSTLIRQLAITASAGIHPFGEWPIPPARVLVIDAENTERQWARETRKWANAAAHITNRNMRLACTRRLDLSREMDLGQLHRIVDDHRPDILFIGPLYRLVPGSLNKEDDAAALLTALDTFRDRGLALVIEAHAGHASHPNGDRDLRPRGSSQLLGWPEFGYGLRHSRKDPSLVDMVRWRGSRDASRAWPTKLGRGTNQNWPWRPVTN